MKLLNCYNIQISCMLCADITLTHILNHNFLEYAKAEDLTFCKNNFKVCVVNLKL